jgi:hypothetical protein
VCSAVTPAVGAQQYSFVAPGHTQLHLPGRWRGHCLLVYRRYYIQRKVYPDGRTSGTYSTNKDLFVCTSADGENWETYKLATELPFGSQPGVGLLEGDVLTLISGWQQAQLERHDLARELTDEARLPAVMDEQGRRLPATAGKSEPPPTTSPAQAL